MLPRSRSSGFSKPFLKTRWSLTLLERMASGMKTRPTVISLFSGALGLDLGLEQAGFELRVAVECNKYAVQTIHLNRPKLPVIQKRIEETTTEEILATANLRVGDATVVTAGPSCQAFSTAG